MAAPPGQSWRKYGPKRKCVNGAPAIRTYVGQVDVLTQDKHGLFPWRSTFQQIATRTGRRRHGSLKMEKAPATRAPSVLSSLLVEAGILSHLDTWSDPEHVCSKPEVKNRFLVECLKPRTCRGQGTIPAGSSVDTSNTGERDETATLCTVQGCPSRLVDEAQTRTWETPPNVVCQQANLCGISSFVLRCIFPLNESVRKSRQRGKRVRHVCIFVFWRHCFSFFSFFPRVSMILFCVAAGPVARSARPAGWGAALLPLCRAGR